MQVDKYLTSIMPPPSTKPQKKSRAPSLQQETTLSRFLRWWRKPLPKWWALGLGILAIVQAAYYSRPRIEIVSATALDERDPFATVFLIQNMGPWPLYNLRFGCEILPMHLYLEGVILEKKNETPSGQRPIEKLSSGEPATRDCPIGPQSAAIHITVPNPAAVEFNVIIKYQWPLIQMERATKRHFSVRRSPNGQKFLLVPDTDG